MKSVFTNNITIHNPDKIVFGEGCLSAFISDFSKTENKRLFVLTVSKLEAEIKTELEKLEASNISVLVNSDIQSEPSFSDYQKILQQAHDFKADSFAGIGGGSVLDTAKLVATTLNDQFDFEKYSTGVLQLHREVYLACLPTTAGTGSEVSPNAIFFNPDDGSKVAVIDRCLIPDAVYVDAKLMVGVPPVVTAFTGIDALTHCIEAYVNRFSHPITDSFALEGIRLIAENLAKAVSNGNDLEARSKIALGSMYGGMCLGPVNTAAVHALAYPLGSKYKIAHGISNAMLLPDVLEFNLSEAEDKYAEIAIALGAETGSTKKETAVNGIEIIRKMLVDFDLAKRLSDYNITEDEIEEIAGSAMKIQRLLKNNVKEITIGDATAIYRKIL